MDVATNPMKLRIAYCRRQRNKARTHIEQEAWRAEEEGLRDAALQRNHTDKYRRKSPIMLERYLIGFQDARDLMRIAKVTRLHQPSGRRMSH